VTEKFPEGKLPDEKLPEGILPERKIARGTIAPEENCPKVFRNILIYHG
jgi:hypothetical protein